MEEKKRNVPKLRFPGFTDEWEQRKFGDVTVLKSASRVHKEEWTTSGVPFYRSSDVMAALNGTDNTKAFISEELYEKLSAVSGKLEQGDILVTGGGSVGNPYKVPNNEPLYTKDADLLWVKRSDSLNPDFVYQFFLSPVFRDYLSSISHVGTIAHYTITQLENTPIALPSLDEQNQIGTFLTKIDETITLHQRKLDSIKEYKKGLLQKMFPQDGEKVPELRFPGFTGDWEQRKLGELCERVVRKNKNNESDLPLTISSQYGLIDQRDFFNKVVAAKDMSNYYLLKKGEFAYNKSYSNGFDYGSIKRLNAYDQGCLSTLYICFALKSEDVDSDYLESYFDTLLWYGNVSQICAEGARNHGLLNVDTKAFFDDVSITIPPTKEEQKNISSFINIFDLLLELHQHKLDLMKEYKKGLLQQMFV